MLGDEIGMRTEAVAGAFDLDDYGMVEQAVEQRGGEERIAEDLAPSNARSLGFREPRTPRTEGIGSP